MLRRLRLLVGLASCVVALVIVGPASASSVNCSVYASGGYINCLTFSNSTAQQVKAWHASGLSYRFQFVRGSDGMRWGYWEYSDLNYHAFLLSLSGVVTGQVDNLGTGSPSEYYVSMT